jgi:uncharacterized protein YbaR (Trm112 family)
MPIIVSCPNCRKSFKVSEKHAGKSGPCPNCKQTLRVPTAAEEVKIHAPEAFASGGRSTTGKLITKPIARTDAKFQPVVTVLIAAAVLVAFVVAWVGGRSGLFQNDLFKAVGLLLISPPLAWAGYEIFRDDELEPYRGRELWLRLAACGASYTFLWAVVWLLTGSLIATSDPWNWLMVLPPLVALGGLAAYCSLDLEFGDAMLHYGGYLGATVLLRWAAGLGWIWNAG